mmetsp:Transcript_11870/g.29946  ORF Transcript_11870/g.29946 Transcript_11870/m.29946 type:complete len:342 (-) Transcript_11870:67-1092(-)
MGVFRIRSDPPRHPPRIWMYFCSSVAASNGSFASSMSFLHASVKRIMQMRGPCGQSSVRRLMSCAPASPIGFIASMTLGVAVSLSSGSECFPNPTVRPWRRCVLRSQAKHSARQITRIASMRVDGVLYVAATRPTSRSVLSMVPQRMRPSTKRPYPEFVRNTSMKETSPPPMLKGSALMGLTGHPSRHVATAMATGSRLGTKMRLKTVDEKTLKKTRKKRSELRCLSHAFWSITCDMTVALLMRSVLSVGSTFSSDLRASDANTPPPPIASPPEDARTSSSSIVVYTTSPPTTTCFPDEAMMDDRPDLLRLTADGRVRDGSTTARMPGLPRRARGAIRWHF